MAITAALKIIDNNIVETIRTFLESLLRKNIVEALLVPMETPDSNLVSAALVSNPEMLKNARPLTPLMPVSTARIISRMTKVASPTSGKKIGVLLRSCEVRALIELIKLKQASLENIVLIGIDCFGTYSISDYKKTGLESTPFNNKLPEALINGSDTEIREACQICEYPTPSNIDILIGLIGIDLDKMILVQGLSPEGEKIINSLGLPIAEDGLKKQRELAISKLIDLRKKKKEIVFQQYKTDIAGLKNLQSLFASCINCHNCRVACPLCYCRECFFESPTFDWKADNYIGWADKKGAIGMPTDKFLFHITRLNHMVASCVGCGLCKEACPNDIPVFQMFRMVGDEVQKSFDYVPGRSLDEELPVSVFREDELGEIGI